MKKWYKILLILTVFILLGKSGWRVYRENNAGVRVIKEESVDDKFYYNGYHYVNFSYFVDACIMDGVLLQGAHSDYPEPYIIIQHDLVKKYIRGYGSQYEKIHGPTMYVKIDRADKDNILMFLLEDEARYIREDFVFPSFETSKVEAIVFDAFMDNITRDEQVIADFMDAIYKQGKATDKIAGYLDKEYNTHIYFKYEGCDCVIEFIGRFSIDDGKFTMYKDIKEW